MSPDAVVVYEVQGGFIRLILVDCHIGKGGTSSLASANSRAAAATDQGDLKTAHGAAGVCSSPLHPHSPAATPHIEIMGALLSLPLLAIPSVGTVSEHSRRRIHPPATRPPY